MFMERIVTYLDSISLWINDGSAYPLHHTSRAFHGLIYMLEGEGYHTIQGKKNGFAPGTIHYLPEGLDYGVTLTKPPMRCYVVNFHMSPDSFYAGAYFLSDPPASFCRRFGELSAAWQRKAYLYDLTCLSGVYQLMADLLLIRRQSVGLTSSLEHLLKSTEYLHTHLSDPALRVDTLAEIARLSVRRYSTVFQSVYQQTPKRYMLKLRIERAKDLLTSCVLPMDAVALSCGFTDPFYFSRAFKRAVGIPPIEYRRRFPAP